jgi:hypothetical protein
VKPIHDRLPSSVQITDVAAERELRRIDARLQR